MTDKKIAWEDYNIDKDMEIDEGDEEENKWQDKSIMPTLIMGNGVRQIPKELAQPFKYTRCHKCYTNFNVTPKMLIQMKDVEGVEMIVPLTRYSFVIGIAKL